MKDCTSDEVDLTFSQRLLQKTWTIEKVGQPEVVAMGFFRFLAASSDSDRNRWLLSDLITQMQGEQFLSPLLNELALFQRGRVRFNHMI